MGFYQDDRITFDRAAELVDRWVEEASTTACSTTARGLLETFDECTCRHNKVRVREALSEDPRFEESRRHSGRQSFELR